MRKIGEIYVNTGQIRIADSMQDEDVEGVILYSTPLGDGEYPVFEMCDDEGNIIAMLIDFDIYGIAKWNDEEEK